VSICRLCKTDKQLRNSHIVPEFLHDDLYNEKHQLSGINGVGTQNRQILQKGIREPLLCEDCEQHINEHYEKPFREQWLQKSPLPTVLAVHHIHWGNFDYSSFKLFHLSVIFRASVSSLATYQAVSLGPHEERIRNMILSRNPGLPWQYPMFGRVVVQPETRSPFLMVSAPELLSFKGHRCYGMMYGGVYWCFCISSHRNLDLERIGLQPNGSMPFSSVPWNEVGIVQDAAKILRGW
jgi:hypothetical protein